jgi:hypothetical protein
MERQLPDDVGVLGVDEHTTLHIDLAERIARVVRLGEVAAVDVRDPRDVVRPYVEALLELHGHARAARDYALSDLVGTGSPRPASRYGTPRHAAQWVLAGAADSRWGRQVSC